MNNAIKQASSSLWEWRIAIFWLCLFSFNALGTSLLAALTGANWSQMDMQTKVMIGISVFVNWSGTMMAFISKQAGRIKTTGEVFPIGQGDTQVFTKTNIETK